MRPLTSKAKHAIDTDIFYKTCIRKHEGDCAGRITIEHALKYRNRQLDDVFALLPLCWHHHLVDLDKRYNEYVALKRATEEDLAKYPKSDFKQLRKHLIHIYEGDNTGEVCIPKPDTGGYAGTSPTGR